MGKAQPKATSPLLAFCLCELSHQSSPNTATRRWWWHRVARAALSPHKNVSSQGLNERKTGNRCSSSCRLVFPEYSAPCFWGLPERPWVSALGLFLVERWLKTKMRAVWEGPHPESALAISFIHISVLVSPASFLVSPGHIQTLRGRRAQTPCFPPTPGAVLPPGGEKQRKLSPSHPGKRSCCQESMGMQGTEEVPLYLSHYTICVSPLSVSPLSSLGTLLSPGEKSMKEFEA